MCTVSSSDKKEKENKKVKGPHVTDAMQLQFSIHNVCIFSQFHAQFDSFESEKV